VEDVGGYIRAKFKEDDTATKIQQQGIDIAVAEARVKALAYAIAASRDPNGRLSDQDVNMALGSIVGNGSLMSVTTLIIDNLRQLNKNVQFISEKYSNYKKTLTPGMMNSYNESLNKVAGYSKQMIQKALDSGAVTASGATDIFGNKLEIDDITGVLVENKPLIAKRLFESYSGSKGLSFDETYKEFYTKLQAYRKSRNEEAATDDEAQTLFIEALKAKRGNK
jgi:hypothetical protein